VNSFAWVLAWGQLLAVCAVASADAIQVVPSEVDLQGDFARAQLLVFDATDGTRARRANDRTRDVRYRSQDPGIVTVDNRGQLLARGNGTTRIQVSRDQQTQFVTVRVSQVGLDTPGIGFRSHVAPILAKAGCNMGACHASQYGKGGFILSVFGFDPHKDRDAIVRDRRQRRVNVFQPAHSLFLLKPTMEVPHGGGRRLRRDSVDCKVLSAWLSAGAPKPVSKAVPLERIEVTPSHRVGAVGTQQQLRVVATYSDGVVRDVTHWTQFDALDEAVLDVDRDGFVRTTGTGQSPVMARFDGQSAVAIFVVPFNQRVALTGWENRNFVDELVEEKFRELGLEPSLLCDDATFLRRAFLDATGSTPTVAETVAFLDSDDPDKRDVLVDRLLGLTGNPKLDIYNDRYAAHWTLKWSDLIRNTSGGGSVEQAMWSMHNWIKESFRTNVAFDKMVGELVTAKGSVYMNGPANYFRINRNATDLAESTAQLFLGVRLQCAKCHHHPFEKYSQSDYYGFAAFFSRVGTKSSQEFGLFGRESVVMVKSSGEVRHPRLGKNMLPTPLEGTSVDHPLDRRIPLADWLRSTDNPFFARSVVNRYMAYLLGRGLVDPVDDMRATNPPSNVALMDALAQDFIDSGFNLKHLLRTIMVSRVYQLDSRPTSANASDRKFYSFFAAKRIAAEPLLDAIDQATHVRTKFKNLPLGTRAIELPDAEYPNYFLMTFAKPKRASVCECERVPDANLAQALHTLNGEILVGKIGDKRGLVAQLLEQKKTHREIVDRLFLATLCRRPTSSEQEACQRFLDESPNPRECYEDLQWGLINSKQFLFVH